MAPAVRVSSSPATRCLRSPPRRARRGGERGTGSSPLHSPPDAGGLPLAHLLPGARQPKGGGLSVPILSLPSRREEEERDALVGLFGQVLLRNVVRNAGEREQEIVPSLAGSPLLWGEGQRGYNGGAEPASWGGRSPANPNSAEVH